VGEQGVCELGGREEREEGLEEVKVGWEG